MISKMIRIAGIIVLACFALSSAAAATGVSHSFVKQITAKILPIGD
jgi:hypothetical protein